MTSGEFSEYYDSAAYTRRHRSPDMGRSLAVMNTARIRDEVPYGRAVEAIAFDLLVDRRAAILVRHEVFRIAIVHTHNFSDEDIWSGNSRWSGLESLTMACTVKVLRRPAEKNPLARPLRLSAPPIDDVHSKWWAVAALKLRRNGLLPFQVGCLTVLNKSPKGIARLLSKEEDEISALRDIVIQEIEAALTEWEQNAITDEFDVIARQRATVENTRMLYEESLSSTPD